MIIVLDTNIAKHKPFFNSHEMERLLAFVKHTNARLILPEIVVQELVENYRKDLMALADKIKALEPEYIRLGQGKTLQIAPSEDEIKNRTEEYEKWLTEFASKNNIERFSYKGEKIDELVEYAIKCKKPGGNSVHLKDLLVWIAVRHLSAETTQVYLISRDNDFSESESVDGKQERVLHSELSQQLDTIDARLFAGIGEFLGSIAPTVSGIDLQWFKNQQVANEVREMIDDNVFQRIVQSGKDPQVSRDEIFHRTIHGLITEPEYLYARELDDGTVEITVWFKSRFSVGSHIIRPGESSTYTMPIMTAASVKSMAIVRKGTSGSAKFGSLVIYDTDYGI